MHFTDHYGKYAGDKAHLPYPKKFYCLTIFRCYCKLQGRILHTHFIVGPFQDLSATWSGVLLFESSVREDRIKDKNHNKYFVLFK